MADESDKNISQKNVPPWAKGKNLRHVEQNVLIPMRVRDITKEKCKTDVQAFIDCCRGRTISMIWKCRKQNRAMQECLARHYEDGKIFEEATEQYLKEREAFQTDYSTTGKTKEFKKKEPATF